MLIGDMNINTVETNLINNEYLDKPSEFGFNSLINVCTRTPMNYERFCLDHIFIKYKTDVVSKIKAEVLQIRITNHFSIVLATDIKNIIKLMKNAYKIIN